MAVVTHEVVAQDSRRNPVRFFADLGIGTADAVKSLAKNGLRRPSRSTIKDAALLAGLPAVEGTVTQVVTDLVSNNILNTHTIVVAPEAAGATLALMVFVNLSRRGRDIRLRREDL